MALHQIVVLVTTEHTQFGSRHGLGDACDDGNGVNGVATPILQQNQEPDRRVKRGSSGGDGLTDGGESPRGMPQLLMFGRRTNERVQ